jgi:hypothetical protein
MRGPDFRKLERERRQQLKREKRQSRRRAKRDGKTIDAGSIKETLHLLSSPANAKHLFAALDQADRGETISMSFDQLRARTHG